MVKNWGMQSKVRSSTRSLGASFRVKVYESNLVIEQQGFPSAADTLHETTKCEQWDKFHKHQYLQNRSLLENVVECSLRNRSFHLHIT